MHVNVGGLVFLLAILLAAFFVLSKVTGYG